MSSPAPGGHERPRRSGSSDLSRLTSTLNRPAPHRWLAVLQRHRVAVAASMVVCLGGFAAAAFGTASFGTGAVDPSLLTPTIVSEAVAASGVAAQIDALASQTMDIYRGDTTRSSDTADRFLRRLSITDASASLFLRTDSLARRVFAGAGGKQVQVRTDEDGNLVQLVARYAPDAPELLTTQFNRLTIARVPGANRYSVHLETLPLERQLRVGSGTVRNSLFAATDEAHLPDAIASQLTEVFAGQIDFHHQLRRGDRFSVVYEALSADSQPCGWLPANQSAGRVLAAEFVNHGQSHTAIWFQDASAAGKGAYFDAHGVSTHRAFLASPLAFSRVTSGFSMRFHPIMQLWRHHDGIDFGAPTGTPVKAVGDAVVDFAGWQNGYGNVVVLQHSGERSTVYAHLSRVQVRKGQRVAQASVIGAVGSTGWATGPHLHFEFKLRGRQLDPIAVAKAADTMAVADGARAAFAGLAATMSHRLAAATPGIGGDAYGD